MTKRIENCAHCGDDHRLNRGEGRVCRACELRVCDGCYAASTETDCRFYGDPAKGSPGERSLRWTRRDPANEEVDVGFFEESYPEHHYPKRTRTDA